MIISFKISIEIMFMFVKLKIEFIDQKIDYYHLQLRFLSKFRLSFDVCDVHENSSLKRTSDYEISF